MLGLTSSGGADKTAPIRGISVSVKARLIVCLSLLALALAAVTIEGWRATAVSHGGLADLVGDEINHIDRLKRVSDLYAVDIVDTAHKVRSGALGWSQGRTGIRSALSRIEDDWTRIKAVELDENERRLVTKAETAMGAAQAPIERLLAAMDVEDRAALDAFVVRSLYPAIDPIGEPLSELVKEQLEAARRNFDVATEAYDRSRATMTAIGVASLLVLGFAIWVVLRGVAAPLARLQAVMTRLASGDARVDIPFTERRDEIGAMAGAVRVFKDNAIARLAMEEEQSAQREARERRVAHVERIIASFDDTVRQILDSVASASVALETTAGSLSSIADEGSRSARDVSSSADAASANVKTVAAAAEELSASIGEISGRTRMSADVAAEAQTILAGAEATVERLTSSAQNIVGVVQMISAIADQTNLLALNATIEAARAGESGRGFAVVASEVKNLAGQTARATGEIDDQVEALRVASNGVARTMLAIGEIVRRMADLSTDIACAVEQQGSATQDIARTISDIACGNDRITTIIADVMRGSTATGSRASQVLTSSCELSREATSLRSEVNGFLQAVRAA